MNAQKPIALDGLNREDYEGRIALVTGATRGIGRAIALGLAHLGATIVATGRPKSRGALEELDDDITKAGGTAVLVPIDFVKTPDGLDQLGGALYERFGMLDMLVGNAGQMGPVTPTSHIDPKAIENLLAINVSKNLRLIRAMEPLLRASATPRALFITADYSDNNPFYALHNATKAALDALVLSWAEELRQTPIRVNLADPGSVATQLRRNAHPGEDQDALTQPEDLPPFLLPLLSAGQVAHGNIYRFNTLGEK